MGWFKNFRNRGRDKRNKELDPINQAFGFDDPEYLALSPEEQARGWDEKFQAIGRGVPLSQVKDVGPLAAGQPGSRQARPASSDPEDRAHQEAVLDQRIVHARDQIERVEALLLSVFDELYEQSANASSPPENFGIIARAPGTSEFVEAYRPLLQIGHAHVDAARVLVAEAADDPGVLGRPTTLGMIELAMERVRSNLAMATDIYTHVATLAKYRMILIEQGEGAEYDPGLAWVQIFRSDVTLPLEAYSSAVTDTHFELRYRMENADGNFFDFDAFLGGKLTWTVADMDTHFVLDPNPDPPRHLVGLTFFDAAREQLKVSKGYPIQWCVQTRHDSIRLQRLIELCGITGIEVRHVPVA